jgi:hypothetical protein
MLAHSAPSALRHEDHQHSWGGLMLLPKKPPALSHLSAGAPPKLLFHDLEVARFPTGLPKVTAHAMEHVKGATGQKHYYTHIDQ